MVFDYKYICKKESDQKKYIVWKNSEMKARISQKEIAQSQNEKRCLIWMNKSNTDKTRFGCYNVTAILSWF